MSRQSVKVYPRRLRRVSAGPSHSLGLRPAGARILICVAVPASLRCERNQDRLRLRHSAGAADTEYRAELEPGADGSSADRLLRRQGRGRRLEVMIGPKGTVNLAGLAAVAPTHRDG